MVHRNICIAHYKSTAVYLFPVVKQRKLLLNVLPTKKAEADDRHCCYDVWFEKHLERFRVLFTKKRANNNATSSTLQIYHKYIDQLPAGHALTDCDTLSKTVPPPVKQQKIFLGFRILFITKSDESSCRGSLSVVEDMILRGWGPRGGLHLGTYT